MAVFGIAASSAESKFRTCRKVLKDIPNFKHIYPNLLDININLLYLIFTT